MSCFSQEGKYRISLHTDGAIYENVKDPALTERYGQWQKLALEMSLSKNLTIQAGMARSRIANLEFLEFPLLFKHQVTEKLHAFTGVQAEVALNRQEGGLGGSVFLGTSTVNGVNYDFTPSVDAGIQFAIPLLKSLNVKNATFEDPQPIRLRTGIKF